MLNPNRKRRASKPARFPNRITDCRYAVGITQDDLAKLVGVTQPAISAFEIGRIQPTVITALLIAKGVCSTVEALWGDGEAKGG